MMFFADRLTLPSRSRLISITFMLGFLSLPLAIMSGCSATSNSQTGGQSIQQSPNDTRQYEHFTLANQLRVLVISDPSSDKAAASLDVNVGSGHDPLDRAGLAHFLEHMLFLGTEKYPDAGAYQQHLSENGGNHNAFTAFDHTNYFFDVKADALAPTLDRFAQFFIGPLFTPDYVEREKNAVDSEYQSKLKDDGRRKYDVLKQSINPKHPLTKFSVGSLASLADRPGDPIRDDLLAFYAQHYSANRMTLVVLGRESTTDLKALVQQTFADIPNHNSQRPVITEALFQPNTLPKRVNINPIKDSRELNYFFALPSLQSHYRTKPMHYIANLLGHEGEGSLLSYLKQQGWAQSLAAGIGVSTPEFASAYIAIRLTPQGLNQVDAITTALYQAVARIKQDDIEAWRFNEEQQLANIGFEFQEQIDGIAYVRSLSQRMHHIPANDILYSPYRMDQFKPELIRDILAKIKPSNMLMTVVAKDLPTDQVTQHFQTPYSIEPVSAEQLTQWQNVTLNPAITLPPANPFIPEQLDIAPAKNAVAQPTLLKQAPGFALWHQLDSSFNTPRANFYFTVRSPQANRSARHAVLTRLYTKAVNENLNSYSYPARLAGLHYSVYPHIRGFTTKINGFQDKQPVLLNTIVERLGNIEVSSEQFQRYQDELRRSLLNKQQARPYNRTIELASKLITNPSWTDQAMLRELADLTLADLRNFAPQLLAEIDVAALAHGNVTASQALTLGKVIEDRILKPAAVTTVPKQPITWIADNTNGLYQFPANHNDAATAVYYQGANDSIHERAYFSLFSQMLSQPFYTQLRTEQQLGYIVFATQLPFMDVPGTAFVIQSPNTQPGPILEKIDTFIADFMDSLESMDDATFDQHKAALVARILEKETRLKERSDRYWYEIDRGNFSFDTRSQLAAHIKGIEKNDLIAAYRKVFLTPEKQRRISLVALGNGQQVETTTRYQPIEGIRSFKQQ